MALRLSEMESNCGATMRALGSSGALLTRLINKTVCVSTGYPCLVTCSALPPPLPLSLSQRPRPHLRPDAAPSPPRRCGSIGACARRAGSSKSRRARAARRTMAIVDARPPPPPPSIPLPPPRATTLFHPAPSGWPLLPAGPVAQWIRHRPTEPGIAGSSPAGIIAAASLTVAAAPADQQ